jgi:predicted RNase H-like HicB family nuclease
MMLETRDNSSGRRTNPVGAREYLCVARRGSQWWEALCLDFDLAVQGRSFDEVRALLEEAVKTYLEDAAGEAEPTRSRLLSRRVPLHVRALWAWRFVVTALRGSVQGGNSAVWLPITCHS